MYGLYPHLSCSFNNLFKGHLKFRLILFNIHTLLTAIKIGLKLLTWSFIILNFTRCILWPAVKVGKNVNLKSIYIYFYNFTRYDIFVFYSCS